MRRTRLAMRLARVLAVAVLATACSPAAPAPRSPSSSIGTAAAAPNSASTSSSSSATASASTSPSASDAAHLPVGRMVFDRYATDVGPEGAYVGTFVLGTDGVEHAITVPMTVEGLDPVLSPDGLQILANTFTPPDGPGRPAILMADGTEFHVINPKGLKGDIGCHGWSPDGTTLACERSLGNHPEIDGIWTMRVDGSGLKRLTTSPFHQTVGADGECGGGDGRAVFAPDGKRIAFIRQKCGKGSAPDANETGAIFVVNADGSALKEVLPHGSVRTHPGSRLSWAPDGSAIVFGDQDGSLFTVHPDGSNLHPIVLLPALPDGFAYGPSWSPDGRWIAFSLFSASTGGTDIYVSAPDGTNLTRITATDGSESFVSWGREHGP